MLLKGQRLMLMSIKLKSQAQTESLKYQFGMQSFRAICLANNKQETKQSKTDDAE